ncbi:hypothetical protein BGX28_010214 [Mortierella sp. GBA30]|nr:hypothetical protein BGX28_010214 [Mortierella sp. GBA30]
MTRSLFAFGSNGNGQLGIASDEDTSVPQLVQFIDDQDPGHDTFVPDSNHSHAASPFLDFASGGNHTALITREHQRLFMTGSNKDNELLFSEPSQVFRSHEISLQDQQESYKDKQPLWRSVACGWAFTIAVTEDHDTDNNSNNNKVYAWGSGSFGELGLGSGLVKTGRNAIAIKTGLLDRTSWICQDQFQVLKVRTGLRHVLLLAKEKTSSDQGQQQLQRGQGHQTRTVLMAWGNNRQGQLGILERASGHPPWTEKELRAKFSEPTRVLIVRHGDQSEEQKAEIVDMTCGQNHSLVLFSDGIVYASGCNKYGQLGPVLDSQQDPPPKFRIGFEQVKGLPYVDSISCGWNHNAAMDTRSMFASQEGSGVGGPLTRIYLWGRNDHGQLGNNAAAFRTVTVDLNGSQCIPSGISEVRIPKDRISDAVRITTDEKEYEEIVSYSCGSEHTLAMTRSGHCYAWGWNEHGNCGNGSEAIDEDLKDVPLPRRVQFASSCPLSTSTGVAGQGWVTGGYGSSWVWM